MSIDVAEWLGMLGSWAICAGLRGNDIDGTVPPDLVGLGIASIGHRREHLVGVGVDAELARPARLVRTPVAGCSRI